MPPSPTRLGLLFPFFAAHGDIAPTLELRRLQIARGSRT